MGDRKKTVLAIDDDITILNTIRTVLEGTYEVSLAKNLEIAKTILNTTSIDIILLDMNMPGHSGLEFLETIQQDPANYRVPVIIVSSQGTADVIIETKKKGAVDFVVKPIAPNILLEKIRLGLKTAGVKISRESLERKLNKLSSSCVAGKSSLVEEVLEGLEQVYIEPQIDNKIAEICKFSREMEYNLVNEKIKELLANLSGQVVE